VICCEWIIGSGRFSAYPTVGCSFYNLLGSAPVVAFVMISVGGSWIVPVVLLLTLLTSSFDGWLATGLTWFGDVVCHRWDSLVG
jgi:hypothetical protein